MSLYALFQDIISCLHQILKVSMISNILWPQQQRALVKSIMLTSHISVSETSVGRQLQPNRKQGLRGKNREELSIDSRKKEQKGSWETWKCRGGGMGMVEWWPGGDVIFFHWLKAEITLFLPQSSFLPITTDHTTVTAGFSKETE